MSTIVRGACPLDCPDTCSWLVEVEDGRAVSLRGDRTHPFTHGALCPKVNRYLDALHGPGRVTHPLRRVGAKGEGRFEQIGWDEALERDAPPGCARRSSAHGPESVLPYYFAGTEGMVQGWIMGPAPVRGARRLAAADDDLHGGGRRCAAARPTAAPWAWIPRTSSTRS